MVLLRIKEDPPGGPQAPRPPGPRPHAIKEPKTFSTLSVGKKSPGARRGKATLSIRAQARLNRFLTESAVLVGPFEAKQGYLILSALVHVE